MWNNKFPISKPLFDTVKASDFDTVRIPVSYMDKIGNEASGYKIEEAWLNRVQEVVDLAINAGLLVVIDIHHDGSDGVQKSGLIFQVMTLKLYKQSSQQYMGTYSRQVQWLWPKT